MITAHVRVAPLLRASLPSLSAALVLLAITARTALATMADPMNLKACVRAAGVVFAGTVTAKRPEVSQGVIVTKAIFSGVVYAKGMRDSDSLVLTVCGGRVEGKGLVCDGEPEFQLHQRYIVLAKDGLGSYRDAYSPIVYFNQGVFSVETKTPDEPPIVRWGMGGGEPVIGYRDGHLVFTVHPVRPSSYLPRVYTARGVIAYELVPAEADRGVRYTEAQFLALIRQIEAER